MDGPEENDLLSALDEMAASTDRLLRTVDELADADVRVPSLLPGWTRAHVLTHVARNADGLVNLVEAARTGEDRPMYAGGRAGRDADIEAGADRHIGDLRLDVAESAERLLAAFAGFPAAGLDREVAFSSGATAYGWEIPYLRVREVEIHHVDLGLGYGPDDWTQEFTTRSIGQVSAVVLASRDCPVRTLVATDVDGRWQAGGGGTGGSELSGPCRGLLGWLIGRTSGAGLTLSPAGEVPPAPPWS